MNKKSLIALLNQFDSPHWCTRFIGDTKERVEWLPVFNINDHQYGLTKQGTWHGEYNDNKRLLTEKAYYQFFIILEFSRAEFFELFKQSIKDINLPEAVIKTFPFDLILEDAMTGPGGWGSLAFKWIEGGYPLSPNMILQCPENIHVIRWKKARLEKLINEY
jgi:hypothetical protein